MSTTNENLGANRELEEAWFNEGETKVSSFEEIRKTIAQRKPYHYLPLSVSAEENSTIFLAIYEERAANRISAEEASTLQREYFETLDPSESAPDVFMDILAAKSKGWITAKEAASAIDNIVLDTRDSEIYSDLIIALAKEADTFILPLYPSGEKAASPVEAPTKPLAEEKRMYQNPSFLQRYVSRKALLAGVALLSLGGAVSGVSGLREKAKGNIGEAMATPNERPSAPEKTTVVPTKTAIAPTAKPATAPVAPANPVVEKPSIATTTPATPVAPVAPVETVAPTQPETATISIPVITKINSAGKATMDQSKSMMAWKKMGYSIGIKTTSDGKVFVLKNEEGQKFIVSQENIQPGQEVIEAKPE